MEEFANHQDEYQAGQYWGMSTTYDLKNCNPLIIRSKELLGKFAIELCDEQLLMKRWGETTIHHFGLGNKEGFTLVQLIETSNVTAHFANDTNSAYIDIFSCKYYDPVKVGEYLQNFFQADEVTIGTTFRK